MKTFSRAAVYQSETFIRTHARPLEQALFATWLRGASKEWVLNELATFQNNDGGFGHGLEPDVQLSDSSILATTVALQHLRELQVSGQHPMVLGAVRYLLDTYDGISMAWPFVPENVDDAPHAPWWEYNADLSHYLANPRAEIVGYLYEYAELIPSGLRESVLADVIDYLEKSTRELKMHELLCYVRLIEAKNLPEDAREQLSELLGPMISSGVEKDPAAWGGYVLKPLAIAPSPSSPFAESLQQSIAVNLDYEIGQQQQDGSWSPNWSWGDAFPEAWFHAKRAWQGILTVNMCKTLLNYDRIDKA